MLHSHRKSGTRSRSYRPLLLLLMLLFVALFGSLRNRAEETVSVINNRHPLQGLPIYVIAAPAPEKMPARPLDVPIVPLGTDLSTTPDPADLQLPFPMSADQAVKIGSALIEDEDFQMALPYFESAQKEQPASPDVLVGLARCYHALKRHEEALGLYKEAAAKNAGSWHAHFFLGRIHLENGRYAEAVEPLNNAYRLKPDDPETISAYGIALSKSGKSTEAIPHLTRVARLKRYIKEDLYYLGEAYANDGQWLKAAEAFKEGVDLRGIDPHGYFYWATMLFNADKLDEALEGYDIVRKRNLSGTHAGAAAYTAEIHRIRGKLPEALSQYQLVLQQKPNDVEALFQAGYISFKLEQLGQAKDLFRKLTKVDPKHAGGAANLAALEAQYDHIRISRNEPIAGVTLRDVVKANPGSAEAHINLGGQLITAQEFTEAVTVLEQAVRLRPNSAAANYNLGLAQLKTGQYENSVTSTRKALGLRADWPEAFNNLGLAYAGLGRWEEAITAYSEAVRRETDYAGAYHNLGIAYVRSGQKERAVPLVEKLKPLSWDLQARLNNEILGVQIPANVVATATPSPAVPVSPPALNAVPVPPAESVKKPDATADPPIEMPCPEPIYRPSGVTRMATITDQLQVSYSEEASQNKVEGRIVLQVVLCGNARISEITVKESLPFGLTERAIEAMKKVRFQPALLDSKPVTVIVDQSFACAQSVCTLVPPQ